MKKLKKILETGLIVICAAGFFGFIYPELCLTEETVKEAESALPPQENSPVDVLALAPEQIKIRFRLWEAVTGK